MTIAELFIVVAVAAVPGLVAWAVIVLTRRRSERAGPAGSALAVTAGWYPDPTGRHEYRYFEGSVWTDAVSDRGLIGYDELS